MQVEFLAGRGGDVGLQVGQVERGLQFDLAVVWVRDRVGVGGGGVELHVRGTAD